VTPTTTTVQTDDGVRLFCQIAGPEDAPPLLFVNSLGTDFGMWEPQVATLAPWFRVIRYDSRGHGQSDAPPGPYTLERLGRDALAVLDSLGVERAHVCGLSLGGMVGLWLAIHRPARLGRAILANTAARIGSEETWSARIAAVEAGGMAAIRDAVLARFLSAGFRERAPDITEMIGEMLLATPPHGYVGCCAALRDADLRNLVSTIETPSLVIGGALDEATPPAQAEDLHAGIVPSELLVIPNVAHLSNLEAPDLFTRRLIEHLTRP
jgi:3-oxoadipate enol-lactonase